jgi:hypothetical protein
MLGDEIKKINLKKSCKVREIALIIIKIKILDLIGKKPKNDGIVKK